MFGKIYQKMLLDKVECLANTYKSGGLSCKLPKKTRYMKVQTVYKTPLNVQTPKNKITNSSSMTNTKCAENEHEL